MNSNAARKLSAVSSQPSAKPQPVKPSRPDADAIDIAAERYYLAQAAAQDAAAARDEAKQELLMMVERYGTAAGEKSKELAGETYRAVASYRQKVEVVPEIAQMLQVACTQLKHARWFKKLVTIDIRYRVQRGAQGFLDSLTDELPERGLRELRELFSKAQLVSDNAPTVTVTKKK